MVLLPAWNLKSSVIGSRTWWEYPRISARSTYPCSVLRWGREAIRTAVGPFVGVLLASVSHFMMPCCLRCAVVILRHHNWNSGDALDQAIIYQYGAQSLLIFERWLLPVMFEFQTREQLPLFSWIYRSWNALNIWLQQSCSVETAICDTARARKGGDGGFLRGRRPF